ncbi:hypothetical protein K8Q98_00760 [Candidatus Nomurabacteria bacterium]|nr:hypothetical protein [Candidatus Nomurabacteria bacterium]
MNEGLPNKEVKRPPAQQEWVDAFYRGVSLIPQHGDGIRLSVLVATVLDNPNTNWEAFFHSKLTSSQLDFFAKTMAAQHKIKDVRISTKKYAGTFEDGALLIAKKRLDALWEAYMDSATRTLLSYIFKDVKSPTGDTPSILKEFFTDPKHESRVKELRAILSVVKSCLVMPEVIRLTAEYRSEFKKGTYPLWPAVYRGKFMAIIKEKVAEKFNGVVPKDFDSLFHYND